MSTIFPHKHTYFRRQFVWYFLGILVTAFVVTVILEALIVFLIALGVQNSTLFTHNRPLQIVAALFLIALPCLMLILATLLFARHMGRKISQPVNELMQAVEKIRQRDLNFSIHYQGRNELGDLCSAFNELRSELQDSLEREWRKQEEMRTMITALSHNLRTPVTIIQGHIESLAHTEIGEKRNQRLERSLPVLEASSQRMTRLLNEILLVSALEETCFMIQPEQVQLEEMMQHKAYVYTLQAASHEIDFNYTYRNLSAQPGRVIFDQHHVEQVLDNLFENALRSTPAHGKISLICTYQPPVLSWILQDTGHGIHPQDLPHIFEKFYQGMSQSRGKGRPAGGLGLSICKMIVEKHGGTIAIENLPAGGCEATVCLSVSTL